MAALFQGTAVRRQVEAQQRSTSVMPQWSYGGPPQSAWSAAGQHRSSPLVPCHKHSHFILDTQNMFTIYQNPIVFCVRFNFYWTEGHALLLQCAVNTDLPAFHSVLYDLVLK